MASQTFPQNIVFAPLSCDIIRLRFNFFLLLPGWLAMLKGALGMKKSFSCETRKYLIMRSGKRAKNKNTNALK
jgi:hypothetical protein